MPDVAYYWTHPQASERRLFVHAHVPSSPARAWLVMLNPLFDEKKHVQSFQVHLGRELANLGCLVLRVDYHGTGDSTGESFEFEIERSLADLDAFLSAPLTQHSCPGPGHILGVRFGADLALEVARRNSILRTVWLVEPVVDGKRYLAEQRVRRNMHAKLNRIEGHTSQVDLNGFSCEDQQGFLLSPGLVASLREWQSQRSNLVDRDVFLLKTTGELSEPRFEMLRARLQESNRLRVLGIAHCDFWARLEAPDLRPIVASIVEGFQGVAWS